MRDLLRMEVPASFTIPTPTLYGKLPSPLSPTQCQTPHRVRIPPVRCTRGYCNPRTHLAVFLIPIVSSSTLANTTRSFSHRRTAITVRIPQ